jgi:hypothetical protein
MKTIIIDRSKWRTGDENDCATGKGWATKLENSDGFKCCLGFICEDYGKDIRGKYYPRGVGQVPFLSWYKKGEGYVDTELALEAATINDSDLPLKVKEKKLKEIFKGKFKLKFVGVPVPYKD